MQKESSVRKNKKMWISLLVILVLIPGTLLISWHFGSRKYYLCSLLLMVYAMLPFFAIFEKRKPQARELVTIAVMCAIAVASRAAFVMVPFFKPMTGIIMITGMALGAETGFLTGAISGFVSNFLFGQGPWTPWQMFAFGIAGFLAGICCKKGWISEQKRTRTALFGGVVVMGIVGPILDTCSFFTMSSQLNAASASGIYLAGLPVNAIHALATVLTLFFLCRPIMEKLDRIKRKYGMLEGAGEAK